MSLQAAALYQFAEMHRCFIEKGTQLFRTSEATPYLKPIEWHKELNKEGYTLTGSLENISAQGINEVVKFFALLQAAPLNLTAIHIPSSTIDDSGAEALAKHIEKTKALQVLDFHHSHVSEKGLLLIIQALKVNKTILQINLRSNKVTAQKTLYKSIDLPGTLTEQLC